MPNRKEAIVAAFGVGVTVALVVLTQFEDVKGSISTRCPNGFQSASGVDGRIVCLDPFNNRAVEIQRPDPLKIGNKTEIRFSR